MPNRSTRIVVALVAGAVLMAFLRWLDNTVMSGAEQDAIQSFRMGPYSLALSVGYLVVAGSVLAIGIIARWAGSLWVGISYALIGAFFAFLRAINFGPAVSDNGAAPLLPEPLVKVVADAYASTGPLSATAIFGAGMLLVGGLIIAQEVRRGRTEGPRQRDAG